MREFAFDELYTYRCRVCGSKNKMVTALILDRCNTRQMPDCCRNCKDVCAKGCKHHVPIVGYATHCCNCGHHMEWTKTTKDEIAHINHATVAGPARCIQIPYCPHKECKLYGTCPPFDGWTKKKPLPPKPPEKLHLFELDVKPEPTPKYL